MKNPAPTNRTCLACGIEKPLAAFLQLSGTQGTIYGNICSSCRSTGAKGKVITTDADIEEGRGASGLRIDLKTKTHLDTERKQQDKKLKELAREKKKKQEKGILHKTETTELKEKTEKEHRINYIEAKKKQSFLGTPPAQKQQIPPRVINPATQEERVAAQQHQQTEETKKLEIAIEQDNLLNKIDINQLGLDPLYAGFNKMESEVFKSFKAWIGTSANFRNIERINKTTSPATNKPDNKTKQTKDKTQAEKDAFTKYVEETFKPNSPRGKG